MKAKEWSNDISGKSKEWSKEVAERGKAFSSEVSPAASRAGNGLGHAIGVLFKAFFLFVAGVVVFALFVALMAILFSGAAMFGVRNFILDGISQNFLAIGTLILFFGIPIIASVVWLIRRMAGVRSRNNYLGYIFGGLWTIGWVCFIFLLAFVTRQFKRQESVKEEVVITSPLNGRLAVDVKPVTGKYYSMFWFNDNDNERDAMPALSENEDSLLLNTVRIRIIRSQDSAYHGYLQKFSRAGTAPQAEANAEKISFPVAQKDSILYLPKGFAISKDTKFRNQQVMVVLEVPVGKQILVDNRTEFFSWFNINTRVRGNGMDMDWDDDRWNNDYSWRTDVWYTMTTSGLERTDKNSDDEDTDTNNNDKSNNGGEYRYKKSENNIDSIDINLRSKDTTINIKLNTNTEEVQNEKEAGGDAATSEKTSKVSSYTGHMISVFNLLGIMD